MSIHKKHHSQDRFLETLQHISLQSRKYDLEKNIPPFSAETASNPLEQLFF
jgi:hypothetical protein